MSSVIIPELSATYSGQMWQLMTGILSFGVAVYERNNQVIIPELSATYSGGKLPPDYCDLEKPL